MRRIITLLATLVLASIGSIGSFAVAGAAGPVVTGGGVGTIAGGPFDADTVQIEIGAGRFDIVHHSSQGGVFAHLQGYVDCTSDGGGTAVVTGVITAGVDGLGVDPVGERVSIGIIDGAPETMALDVSFFSGHTIPRCTSDPVLVLAVDSGRFTLH